MEKIELPTLLEIVILFPEQHMICLIESSKIHEIENLIATAIEDYSLKGEKKLVRLNSVSGRCYFVNHLVYGFYSRGCQPSVNDDYHKKILEMSERQVKASEKIAGEIDKGENWKS